MNKEEHIQVITDVKKLYDKCENMEQLFDKYYLPLLDKHYSKVYQLQQENKQLKEENMNLRNIKIYKQDDDLLICVGEDCKRFKLNTNELLWIKEKGDSNE